MKPSARFLNILFFQFVLLSFLSCDKSPVLYMIGDSTMANKPLEDNPERGWGQLLPIFFDSTFTIENHAVNGRSTRSFIYEGRWDSVLKKLSKGDFVIIQFGHNDEFEYKIGRHSTLEEYKYNLTKYVCETRKLGAEPILCTPIMRRSYDSVNVFYDSHGEYPKVVRDLAKELNVTLIDMHKSSEQIIEYYGFEKSKDLYLHIKPGVYKTLPEGKEDNTHFSEKGAKIMAELFVKELKEKTNKLAKYLKEYENEN